ncbi:CNP1-like family protein [Craterilacuibacter sp.]|uniref:CNP1-like family protein n=1 Tax=Craterilacuibacter sp. TaxID=2870909 RepID=UPI003F3CBA10
MKKTLLSLALATLTATAIADSGNDAHFKRATANSVDDDAPWVEQAAVLPVYPLAPEWLDFSGGNLERNRLALDGKSITLGQDGVVRYSLRVLTPGGVANISREGLRCQTQDVRSYAFADTVAQRWIESMKPLWRPIRREDTVRRALKDLLCDGGTPRRSAEATIEYIRKHP